VLLAGAGVGREAGKEAGPDEGRVNAGGGGLAGAGFAVLTTPAGPGNDGTKSGCMDFRLASRRVAPGSGAGVGKEAGKEAGLAVGRVSGGRGGLASPGAAVLTASEGPDNDEAPSAFFMVLRLASSGVAPGSGAGVGKEAGQETFPDAGRVKVRRGSLVTQLETSSVLSSRASLNHSNLAFFALWASGGLAQASRGGKGKVSGSSSRFRFLLPELPDVDSEVEDLGSSLVLSSSALSPWESLSTTPGAGAGVLDPWPSSSSLVFSAGFSGFWEPGDSFSVI
jgi:hypothetical protein